jgi:hypothetical protein
MVKHMVLRGVAPHALAAVMGELAGEHFDSQRLGTLGALLSAKTTADQTDRPSRQALSGVSRCTHVSAWDHAVCKLLVTLLSAPPFPDHFVALYGSKMRCAPASSTSECAWTTT